jgi:hypothetical protein
MLYIARATNDQTSPVMPVPVYSMWGDHEPLYVILLPMMSLVDVVILVHAGNL